MSGAGRRVYGGERAVRGLVDPASDSALAFGVAGGARPFEWSRVPGPPPWTGRAARGRAYIGGCCRRISVFVCVYQYATRD